MTKHNRVIPRDFFNEAKLLKCMGVLSLAILDCAVPKGVRIVIEESGEPFEVALSDDGMLFLSNYETFVNGQPVTFGTRYNSKRNFPFFCVDPDSGEETDVFDEDGKFAGEFKAAFGAEVQS